MRRVLWLALVLVLSGCAVGNAAQPARPTPSPAVMLASLQKGHTVDAHDPLAVQYGIQLGAIAPYCREDERRIADEALATHRALAKRGVEESTLSIIRHGRLSIPVSAVPAKCADVFAAYAALRTKH